MIFWQEWVLGWLQGKRPAAGGSWRGGVAPAGAAEWKERVARFQAGLKELARWAGRGGLLVQRGRTTRLEMLQTVAQHNSYHAGQVVTLRQTLGAWPPGRARGRGRTGVGFMKP